MLASWGTNQLQALLSPHPHEQGRANGQSGDDEVVQAGIFAQIDRQADDLGVGQPFCDLSHHLLGVVGPLAVAIVDKLLGDVEIALTGNAWHIVRLVERTKRRRAVAG